MQRGCVVQRLRDLRQFGRTSLLRALIPVAIGLFLVACGSSVKVGPIDYNVDPAQAVGDLKTAVEQARAEDVNVLSPTWFDKAEDTNAEAAALLKQSNDLRDMLETAQLGQAQLAQARKFADVAKRELAGPFEAREAAMNAGAPKMYPAEFESVERRFLDLGKSIEDNDIKDARKDGQVVEKRFRELELRAIKEHTLGQARRLIADAEQKRAQKLAPQSLGEAQKALAETEAYITQNPYSPEIQLRADNVLRTAEHIHIVLAEVEKWSNRTVEASVLAVEKAIVDIASLASGEDAALRVQPLDKHFKSVTERVRVMRDSQRFLNTEVSNLQVELDKVGQQQQEQEARQARNARVNRIITLFEAQEADVYRQGETLLIRLKGLNFEVGKAYIQPQHYPLLTKLQNAMNILGSYRAVVEGHTDLTGSLSSNRILSQRRAQAVADWLINSGVITKGGVTVIGYGPDKPIAPNNTAEGRRLNRRIDVILVLR
jgi:outer membrane protein OmpA-like peptidoglycan-associated protein